MEATGQADAEPVVGRRLENIIIRTKQNEELYTCCCNLVSSQQTEACHFLRHCQVDRNKQSVETLHELLAVTVVTTNNNSQQVLLQLFRGLRIDFLTSRL